MVISPICGSACAALALIRAATRALGLIRLSPGSSERLGSELWWMWGWGEREERGSLLISGWEMLRSPQGSPSAPRPGSVPC